MRRALGLSALLFVAVACTDPPATPKAELPTVSENPSIEDRILVCQSDADSAAEAVNRCATSVDGNALANTIVHWGETLPLWSDGLFNTVSFQNRYPLEPTELECLRRAFCQPMPFEER